MLNIYQIEDILTVVIFVAIIAILTYLLIKKKYSKNKRILISVLILILILILGFILFVFIAGYYLGNTLTSSVITP